MTSRFENVRDALPENLPPWGVLVFESHHSAQFSMPWRTHRFAKIVYVLDGAGSFDIEQGVFDFSAGDVFVVPPGTKNRIRDSDASPVSLYACCISNRVCDSDPGLRNTLKVSHWAQQPRRTLAVASILRRMVLQQDRESPSRPAEMLGEAWRLLGLVVSVASTDDTSKKRTAPHRGANQDEEVVRQYISELPANFLSAQTIDEAAETCGLSRRVFTRLFREITETTWLSYVRQIAIDHACGLLRNTNLPIISVAFESGFAELSTFYRQFNKRVGKSPAAYRESSRQ